MDTTYINTISNAFVFFTLLALCAYTVRHFYKSELERKRIWIHTLKNENNILRMKLNKIKNKKKNK